MEKMKSEIVRKIEELGGSVTFVELLKIDGFEGDEAIGHPEYNIAFWIGVSEKALQSIHDLWAEGVIGLEPTGIIPYVIDGRILDLALAEDIELYEETRWAPMVINKGENFYHFLACENAEVSNR